MQDENGNNILTFGGLIPVCTYIKLCFPYRQTVLVQILKTKTHHIKMSLAIMKWIAKSCTSNMSARMPSMHCGRFEPGWLACLLRGGLRCCGSPELKWGSEWSVLVWRGGIHRQSLILAAANIHTPIPLVELHLRNDHTPSLLPQTNKHTTHPTWYVLSFILCSTINAY